VALENLWIIKTSGYLLGSWVSESLHSCKKKPVVILISETILLYNLNFRPKIQMYFARKTWWNMKQFEDPIRSHVWKLKANQKPCLVCLQTLQLQHVNNKQGQSESMFNRVEPMRSNVGLFTNNKKVNLLNWNKCKNQYSSSIQTSNSFKQPQATSSNHPSKWTMPKQSKVRFS